MNALRHMAQVKRWEAQHSAQRLRTNRDSTLCQPLAGALQPMVSLRAGRGPTEGIWPGVLG